MPLYIKIGGILMNALNLLFRKRIGIAENEVITFESLGIEEGLLRSSRFLKKLHKPSLLKIYV